MAATEQNRTVASIDRLLRDGTLTAMRDGQLLDRYLSTRDEAAFEALVNLHGPMVLGLCRRMLRDPRDIEDAFQATFLVLVRKAPALRDRDLVANWLYGVAYRVVVRARANLLRRKSREVALGEIEPPMSKSSVFQHGFDPGLDQELNRLPMKYRDPLLLCYLKGMTHDQAADELRCPVGTVRSRLARGRDLLRRRLVRRGYDPSFAGLALPLPAPASLVRATVEAAANFASARAIGAAAASSTTASLAEGVLTSMTISRFRTVLLSVLAMALTSGGVVAIAWNQARSRDEPPSRIATSEGPKPSLPGPRKIQPGDWLLIEVLEALPGRPISGTRIVRPDGTVPLGFYGDVQVAGLDRNEIKVKVVNHLRKFLTDEVLGLLELDPDTGEITLEPDSKQGAVLKRIKPSDTDRVFVDDSVASYYSSSPGEGNRLDEIERKLDELIGRIDGKATAKISKTQGELERSPVKDERSPFDNNATEAKQKPGGPPGPGNASGPTRTDTKGPTAWPTPPENLDFESRRARQRELRFLESRLASETRRAAELELQNLENQRWLAEAEKKLSHSLPGMKEHDKNYPELDKLKRLIETYVHRADERLKRLQGARNEGATKPHLIEARLAAAKASYLEKKRLHETGVIGEEEFLDAEGDYNALHRPALDLNEAFPTNDELDAAKEHLEFARRLQRLYLTSIVDGSTGTAVREPITPGRAPATKEASPRKPWR